MPVNKTVTALIPAFNEEEYIYKTVVAVLSIPEIKNVVVVDDGSTDHTAREAHLAGAQVLSLPFNMGKGEALNQAAGKVTAGVVLLLDADLGTTAEEARHLIIPILREKRT